VRCDAGRTHCRGKTSQPVAEAIAQTVHKPTAQTVPDPVAEPVAQTVSKAVTQPVAATTPKSDEERIQGRWKAVEGQTTTKKSSDVKAVSFLWVWTFKGARLTTARLLDGKEEANDRGVFSLSHGTERKLFDFKGKRPNGAAVELKGIYEFDGEFLKICYTFRTDPAKTPNLVRPDSFALAPGSRGMSLKFKRVGE
jgi:uncharacterized protein (TIGR03067 family)